MKKHRILLALIMILLALAIAEAAWIILTLMEPGADRALLTDTAQGIAAKGAGMVFDAAESGMPQPASDHVYSHRGSAGTYEHSFRAYDAAIAEGSHYIEQDLVISSDGVLFVSHDLSAADMTGTAARYSSMTADTIDGLQTKAGGKVLRLSEVFDRYQKDVDYIIELKSSGDDTVKAFGEIVARYGFEDVIIVQSSDTDVLDAVERIYPDMPKLYVCKSQSGFAKSLDLPYVDIVSVRADAGLMTEANCEAAHRHGKMFSAWTLDSEQSIKNAIDMGVDTYFTNDTALAMSLEKTYGLSERMRQEKWTNTGNTNPSSDPGI